MADLTTVAWVKTLTWIGIDTFQALAPWVQRRPMRVEPQMGRPGGR